MTLFRIRSGIRSDPSRGGKTGSLFNAHVPHANRRLRLNHYIGLIFFPYSSEISMMTPLQVSLGFLEFPPTYTCDGGNHSPRITLDI